jgi:hypothetical protein
MVISHKHKFIFIKTRKTAGTSLEVFLSTICSEDDILTPIVPHVEPHEARNYKANGFLNHMPARKIQEKVSPDIWESYYKFCVERNPWDKTLSHYHHIAHRRGEPTLSFDQYLDEGEFPRDFNKYTDNAGQLIVDRVLRYETLNQDLNKLFSELHIPFSGDLTFKAKSNYRTNRKNYQEIYSSQQRYIIEKKFANEIELLDYRF